MADRKIYTSLWTMGAGVVLSVNLLAKAFERSHGEFTSDSMIACALFIGTWVFAFTVPNVKYNSAHIKIFRGFNGYLTIPMNAVASLAWNNSLWLEIRWESNDVCYVERVTGQPKSLQQLADFIKSNAPALAVLREENKNHSSFEEQKAKFSFKAVIGILLFIAFMFGSMKFALMAAGK